MIYTLTGNLLWEKTLDFERWEPGKTQRARTSSFRVGGKGLNVSRMLNRLQSDNAAICFPGGPTGAECVAWLRERGQKVQVFENPVPTRAGFVIRAPGQAETTFFEPDAALGAETVRAAAGFLEAAAPGGVLVVCGSIPYFEREVYAPLRDALASWCRRATLVVDTYGAALKALAGLPAALIKINRQEFDGLFPPEQPEAPIEERLRKAARASPPLNWIITDGPHPVWLHAEDGCMACFEPPEIREASPVGSGDVLLACLLHAWLQEGRSLKASLDFALPFAAANAASAGVLEFS